MPVSRHRLVRCAALILFATLPAFAADAINGTVTNKTTGKPSAGDDVVLIQLKQGMQESTRTKTDARGHYKLTVPDDGIHLVRVTHDKANYFKPATPGTQTVDVDVYSGAPKIEGVTLGVQELHIEATDTELHVVEVLQVLNQSAPARTQFGPAGYDLYLPPDARILRTGAITDGGMPVPATAAPVGDSKADPGHYTFLFPIRPGETQFGIVYSMPYAKSMRFTPRLASNVSTLAIVLPKSIKLQPGPSSPYGLSPASGDTQTYIAQNVSPSQPLDFTLSGTGSLPQKTGQPAPQTGARGTQEGEQATADTAGTEGTGNPDPTKFGGGLGKPLDPDAAHDPWSKYKGWILGGLALLLAAGAGVLLRRPATPLSSFPLVTPPPTHLDHGTSVHAALKEELFSLETDRLQKRISEADYESHKRALDLVMTRALSRQAPATSATNATEEPR